MTMIMKSSYISNLLKTLHPPFISFRHSSLQTPGVYILPFNKDFASDRVAMAEGATTEIPSVDNKPEEVAEASSVQDMDVETESGVANKPDDVKGDTMDVSDAPPKRTREEPNDVEANESVLKKLKAEKSVEEKRLEKVEEEGGKEEETVEAEKETLKLEKSDDKEVEKVNVNEETAKLEEEQDDGVEGKANVNNETSKLEEKELVDGEEGEANVNEEIAKLEETDQVDGEEGKEKVKDETMKLEEKEQDDEEGGKVNVKEETAKLAEEEQDDEGEGKSDVKDVTVKLEAKEKDDDEGEGKANVKEDSMELDKEELGQGNTEQGKESAESVNLGPKSFTSSVEMFDYFFKLLHFWTPNVDINEYEHMVLLSLLQKGHMEPEKKIGDGVKAFQVRFHPLWKSRCFFLVRTDGFSDDFSFRKCVDKILPLPDNMKASINKNSRGQGHQKGGRGGHGGKGGRGRGKRGWGRN